MKKLTLFLLVSTFSLAASAQLVATLQLTEDVPGICDKENVYALFPGFEGQVEAVCPMTEDQIVQKLNAEVAFLKENPKYKDKGMMGLLINCNGEVVQCQMDNKTKSPELDKQIEAVFNSLGEWKAGTYKGIEVDTSLLYSFTIKKGVLSFD